MSLALQEDGDAICALSSGAGRAGIAVIRVSGPRSYEIVRALASFLPPSLESHRAFVGILREKADGSEIDQAVVLCFAAGRSYTGDETCEISCHGSPAIISLILRELTAAGCRIAKPGEFTYRAFMNGNLDLVQAEGVLSLIESQSKDAARASLRQVQGRLSGEFAALEDDVVWLLAQLEASIDFSAEGIELTPSRDLSGRLALAASRTARLIGKFAQGRILRDGLSVALVGPPNVGKSSLLNALIGESRAIVADEPGTTRDLVKGATMVGQALIRFVDTAGLRQTDSAIEAQGIAKSRAAAADADLTLAVVSASAADQASSLAFLADPSVRVSAVIINKIDACSDLQSFMEQARAALSVASFATSALTGAGLPELLAYLQKMAIGRSDEASVTVINARHFAVLNQIQMSLNSARSLIERDESPEFIAFELQEAIRGVHELLGKRFDEQVIDRIFKEFCLGK